MYLAFFTIKRRYIFYYKPLTFISRVLAIAYLIDKKYKKKVNYLILKPAYRN